MAKSLVIFPGGFGTLDEMFEILTLMQTEKLDKQIQIILYGTEYWDAILRLDPMAEWGAIGPTDMHLLQRANNPQEAFELLKAHLTEHHLLPSTAQEMKAPGLARTRS
jgi:predicted Rossmann-fold nucleotide-binding protein